MYAFHQGESELPEIDVYLEINEDGNKNRYYENKIINDSSRNESKNNDEKMVYDGKSRHERKVFTRI
jgi:hypothetical protein